MPNAGRRERFGGRKLAAVVKREFLERVRTRWFLVSTLLGPVFFAAITILPAWLALRERGVLTRMLADGSIQVSPPFVISEADLVAIADAIDGALRAMGSSVPGAARTLDVTLLPEQTRDDEGGFDSSDARLRAEVPPHHMG